MSVPSSNKDSDDNQIELREESPCTIDDRTEHDRLRYNEFKKLLERRKKIFPVLIAVFLVFVHNILFSGVFLRWFSRPISFGKHCRTSENLFIESSGKAKVFLQ